MSTPPIDRTDGCLRRKLYPWCASCFVQQKRESSTIVCGQVTCRNIWARLIMLEIEAHVLSVHLCIQKTGAWDMQLDDDVISDLI